jgi:hypothetical protein
MIVIIYQVGFRLVTMRELIYAAIQVSDIFVFVLCFQFINLVLQIFHLFY